MESIGESRMFETVDEMLEYIILAHTYKYNGLTPPMSKEDIIIEEPFEIESRIEWKNWRHILTKRYGDKVYDTPQCIGYCCIEKA